MTDITFENKQPDVLSKEGVNLRDLIRFAAGKGEGEEVTSDDFGKLLSDSGVSNKDAKRLSKAFDTISKNDKLDYILSTSGDGFNVFDKETGAALTRSSRKTGSTKGVTLADLVGLGNNVSTLAGFAGNKIGDYLKPKGEVQSQETPKVPNVAPASQVMNQKTKVPGGRVKQGSIPTSKEKPLDKMLGDQTMRNFLLNPNSSKATTNTNEELPAVELPAVDKSVVQAAQNEDAKRIQKEYSSHLRDNYTGIYNYIIGKEKNLSNSKKIQISGEIGKIKYKQPPMYQYLMKYHKAELDRLTTPNLQVNGSY